MKYASRHMKLCGFLLCFSTICCKPHNSENESNHNAVPKWEYRQLTSFSKDFPGDECNKLGNDGWELIDVYRKRDGGYYTQYTFKRGILKSAR